MSSFLHFSPWNFDSQSSGRVLIRVGMLLVIWWMGTATGARAQMPQADEPTEIVLLGTSHFAGSQLDEYTSSVDDILSDRRQSELDTVAARIAEFAPDQFFIECTPDDQNWADSLYHAYRAGDYNPTVEGDRGEIRQLGFRAAERTRLQRLECVDAEGVWLGDRAHAVAKEHDPELYKAYRDYGERVTRIGPQILANHTIGEWLKAINTDSLLFNNHNAYISYYARMGTFDGSGMKVRRESELEGQTVAFVGDLDAALVRRGKEMLREMGVRVADSIKPGTDYVVLGEDPGSAPERAESVGAQTMSFEEARKMLVGTQERYVGFPDHHIGADLVGEWYKRNLRIYANIWRAVEPESDRVFVMLGQGHIWTLRQFFRENPDFQVVPVAEVL